ncbi:peptidase m56, blar1 domain protein [Heliomicrobium modesticaldum Ice1]|uniref:Peptidase m56, blar1 domain protein n=1 Tax=Heliobacterium modesticaldum (strain ATCC 51547 / Ice1) TaxID=498761 RepID=B0TCW5_HELMI|nr:DUF5301 domain-containing protein [Heliomicrobium modesticaldum]ABZ85416.1 peptidase m56, blar1 domain protein [Heliomicrobium modesticaldum Ice1]
MAEAFLKILNMSITATCVLFAILVLRLPLRRAPKRISYALWGVLLFRLVCPVSFSSFFSLFGLLGAPVTESGAMEYIANSNMPDAVQHIGSDTGYIAGEAANSAAVQSAGASSAGFMQTFLFCGAWVWIAGLALMLIYSVVSYLRLKNRLSTAVPLCGNVFETDEISSPFVCGFLKPRIYLPAGIDETERKYVLLHERAHILRKDHIAKPIAFLALSIHWFNPFMWLAFRLMSRDMEMSCDERAARGLDQDGKVRYGETLMRLAIKRPLPAGSPLAFGEGATKGRIEHMFRYKKPAFWIVCAAVIFAAVWAVLLMANPAQTIELPDTASVFTVEMEQFNDRLSVGRVGITGAEQIDTILSAMAGSKKTLRRSVNDRPMQDNYLVLRLIMENEMRTLCLYSEGGGEYIEEPYIGIYKTRGNSGKVLYQVYTDNMEKSSGNAINIRWNLPADVSHLLKDYAPVRDYAEDYVREQIKYYNSLGYNITDAKITAVTLMNTGTASLTKAVEMWRLEYRLLPDDAEKVVLAGGMKMEDGWLTEWGSTGQPLLVTVHDWDSKSEIRRRVGAFNTLGVQEEYQGDYTAAAMALYHDFISKTGVTWEYNPKSSVFPALPIRINIPFSNAHVSVDRGMLWLNDETKAPNYIDCGKETDYPAGKTILWSPSEGDVFDSSDVANGCILRFEITSSDGSVHKGTILVDQSKKAENGVWFYSVALAETDTGLVLANSSEYGGGCILKLPDES